MWLDRNKEVEMCVKVDSKHEVLCNYVTVYLTLLNRTLLEGVELLSQVSE